MNENAMSVRAQRAASPESQARRLASVIYPGVLKSYARSFFNRDNLWERSLQVSILKEQPIQIVGFWGIGGKQQPDQYDEKLLTEYEAIREAIGEKYPRAADMMLILANSHGRLNGYQGFDGYLEAVAHEANKKGIPELQDGVNCFLGHDGTSLAKHCLKVYDNPTLVNKIGDSARKTYETFFSEQSSGENICTILEALGSEKKILKSS